jgi:hypothetical protein
MGMAKRLWLVKIGIACFMAALIGGGCTFTFYPINPGGEEGKVTVRVINYTAADLDPQIFIADQVLQRNQLFKQANKYTEYGVFNRGVLGPYGQATFTLDCADVRVIGSAGGLFGNDASTNEGDREIILAQETVFLCGDLVTFSYRSSGGKYTVGFDLD